ncbi:uncharacterized protein LOC142351728 [Convolutriloba macropyga]|uniref:uncharacterized protein LOC142351728 n=1 Tax=Convolutriloba macropyga TaxID=536237 RepID=UPI003F5276D7
MDDNMTNEIVEEEVEPTVEPPLYQISEGYIRYWEVLWKLKLGLFSFQLLTGVVNFVLNTYIVCLITFNKHFRKLEFYPLAVNSFVDIWGATLVVVPHEFILLSTLFDMHKFEHVFTGGIWDTMRQWYYLSGFGPECTFYFFRVVFSQYTTGPCVLLLALDRFCAVCMPHRVKDILTRKVRQVLCGGLTVMLIAIFICSCARMKYKWDNGYRLCYSTMYKTFERKIVLDTIFFLVIPGFLSFCMYSAVGWELMKRRRSSKHIRNRNLTIAFLFSTVFWLVCWTPATVEYALRMTRGLLKGRNTLNQTFFWYIFGQIKETLHGNLTNKQLVVTNFVQRLQDPIFLAHAYINPLLILFISRRFQEPARQWWRKHIGWYITKAEPISNSGQGPSTTLGSTNATNGVTKGSSQGVIEGAKNGHANI